MAKPANVISNEVKDIYFEAEVASVAPCKFWRAYGMKDEFPGGNVPVFSVPCIETVGNFCKERDTKVRFWPDGNDPSRIFVLVDAGYKDEYLKEYMPKYKKFAAERDWKTTAWNGSIVS